MILSREEAEALLYREARLLDERRFPEWLKMFAEDCRYWVPTSEADSPLDPSLIFDDRARMAERVFRLCETRAYAQRPPSRTVHSVSNVEVCEPEPDGAVVVHCAVLIVELREGDASQSGLGSQRLLAARCRYVFVGGPDWRIREKKLLLVDRDLPHHNLSFIL
ncbi:MAG TPA: aromatic-ring-hydroxylating dioxygenase subunit beta [Chloroflexota bacterium]|nr:aromatic-ring-hydroxylating dioxygenase subunit beta [Chloroflexota bacterium]